MLRRIRSLNRLRKRKAFHREKDKMAETLSCKVLYVTYDPCRWPEEGPFTHYPELDLALSLRESGFDVHVINPLFSSRENGDSENQENEPFQIHVGKHRWKGSFTTTESHAQLPVTLVRGNDFYNPPQLEDGFSEFLFDSMENLAPYTFFCHAVMEFIRTSGFVPDIIHCHNWQTALIPALLKRVYVDDPQFKNIRSVFSLHEISGMGLFDPSLYHLTGLPWESFNMHEMEFHGHINLIKGGLVYADRITLEDTKIAQNLCTPQKGFGLHDLYRMKRSLIEKVPPALNYQEWNPEKDNHLDFGYTSRGLKKRNQNRQSLLKEVDLPLDEELPFVVMLGPLPDEKDGGMYDLWDVLLQLNAAFLYLLPVGRKPGKKILQKIEQSPDRFSFQQLTSEKMLRRILAGSDIFVVGHHCRETRDLPLKALRYGSVPVVPDTMAGLEPFHYQWDAGSEVGNGFRFEPSSSSGFLAKLIQSINCVAESKTHKSICKNGMRVRFNMEKALQQMRHIYLNLMDRSEGTPMKGALNK